jgi:hypothetical protein
MIENRLEAGRDGSQGNWQQEGNRVAIITRTSGTDRGRGYTHGGFENTRLDDIS